MLRLLNILFVVTEDDPDAFLENARLSCQVVLTEKMQNAVITIPEDLHNMLEVPLWLRKR